MCGLTYYHQKDSQTVAPPILKRYSQQKERGNEGFGFVSFSLDTLEANKFFRCAEEKEVIEELTKLKDLKEKTNAILFHHRNPTSTINIAECAHPIKVDNPELADIYFVVHNGVIHNASKLKEIHEKLGYKYNTEIIKEETWTTAEPNRVIYTMKDDDRIAFNDSEAVAIELARFIEGKQDTVDAKGSMALIALRMGRDNKVKGLYYGHDYMSPLFLEQNKESFCLKSVGAYKDDVEKHMLYHLDYATDLISVRECNLDRNFVSKWHGGKRQDEPTMFGGRSINDTAIVNYDHLAEDDTLGLPPMSAQKYFEEFSQVDTSLENILFESSVEDVQSETLQEFYLVETLLEWEKGFSFPRKDNISRLEARLKSLDKRMDEIDAKIAKGDEKKREMQAYGLDEEDMRQIGFRIPRND